MKKIETHYETSDGAEFDDEKEASRHEELVKAERTFNQAAKNLRRLVAEVQLTADGHPFDFHKISDYYWIGYWDGFPHVRRVGYYQSNCEVDQRSRVLVCAEDHTRKSVQRFEVGELYRDERNAKIALIKACEKKLEEYREQLEQLRAEVFPK